MESGRVRVGVVGLGHFGSFHLRHYAAHPGVRLAAVADADAARAATALQHGATTCASHRDLIGRVDAVTVAVPTSLHHQVAGDLIDAGIHVLVEKPITDRAATARDLVARAEARGVVLQVGHIERFSPTFRALAREVRRPLLVELRRHNAWTGRATDVDVVLDLMIHDIDLAATLAGSAAIEVAAVGAHVAGELADAVNARLVFANGVVADLSASRVAAAPHRTIRVLEEGRALTADLVGRTVTVIERGTGSPSVRTEAIEPADALAAEIAAFVDAVGGRPTAGVSGREGLAALEVAERIRAALPAAQKRAAPRDGAA